MLRSFSLNGKMSSTAPNTRHGTPACSHAVLRWLALALLLLLPTTPPSAAAADAVDWSRLRHGSRRQRKLAEQSGDCVLQVLSAPGKKGGTRYLPACNHHVPGTPWQWHVLPRDQLPTVRVVREEAFALEEDDDGGEVVRALSCPRLQQRSRAARRWADKSDSRTGQPSVSDIHAHAELRACLTEHAGRHVPGPVLSAMAIPSQSPKLGADGSGQEIALFDWPNELKYLIKLLKGDLNVSEYRVLQYGVSGAGAWQGGGSGCAMQPMHAGVDPRRSMWLVFMYFKCTHAHMHVNSMLWWLVSTEGSGAASTRQCSASSYSLQG